MPVEGMVLCDTWPGPDVRGARLVMLSSRAVDGLVRVGGERAVRRAVTEASSASGGGWVAAPAEAGVPFDRRGADIVLVGLPPVPAEAARVVLAAGISAAGRPVLGVVADALTEPDALVAARDVGAEGIAVCTGDDDRDAALAEQFFAAERARVAAGATITVVVCNYNGAHYLEHCLRSLGAVRYPDWEVLVCDDGSTDDSVAIARRFPVRVLELEHGGVSGARNAGYRAAQGDVVAYLDGDAEAEPLWLERLWRALDRVGADGVGGPNVPFPTTGWQERVVAGAPGVAIPVCAADASATHLAGCNMAFRRDALERLGGFDERFPGAYDDVEFCLRLIASGRRLVVAPTATVRHHRRDSIAGYLRQQHSYGRLPIAGNASDLLPRPRQRLVTRRPGPVFSGPQGRQRFVVSDQPLHVGLPLKLLLVASAAAASGAVVAHRRERLREWSAVVALGGAAGLSAMAVKVPVFAPSPGPGGIAQRLATAGLWLAQPAARAIGERRPGARPGA